MKDFVAKRSKGSVGNNDIFAYSEEAKRDKTFGNQIIDGTVGVYLSEDGSLGHVPTIVKGLKEHISDRLCYSPSVGDKDYNDAVEHWTFRDCYLKIHDAYDVFTGSTLGGTGAIWQSCNLFLEQGETMLLPDIMWNNYMLIAKKAGVRYEKYTLFSQEDGFNISSLRKHVSSCLDKDGRVLVMINDPCQNPTGYCMSADEYDELFAMLDEEGERGNVTVLFDIAYLSYYAEERGPFKLFDKLVERKHRFLPVILFSCSKVFGLYGLRAGAMIALVSSKQERKEIQQAFGALTRGVYSCPVGGVCYALSKVMTDENAKASLLNEIEENRNTLKRRGQFLLKELDKAGIKHYPYLSGFYLTIKVNKDAYDVYARLKAKHVYIVPLDKHMMRIALSGLNKSQCASLVKGLKEVL